MVDITFPGKDKFDFPAVPLLLTGQPVRGGAGGASNLQAVALTERTEYLKAQVALLSVVGIRVLGTLTELEWQNLDESTLPVNAAFFVDAALQVWNGNEWVTSGSLLGPRGITLLGILSDNNPLPDPVSNDIGDAYIWKGDLYVLAPPPDDWVSIGLKGDTGLSNYELAIKLGLFVGTEAQYLASLKGGDAYQVWLDAGNTGGRPDFLASLHSTVPGPKGDSVKGDPGKDGKDGENAQPFAVVDNLSNVSQLPRPGVASEAYSIETELYVWVNDKNDYINLGSIKGLDGKSPYQNWLDLGNTGNEAAFLATLKSTEPGPKGDSIKGDPGKDGEKGDPAVPFQVVGRFTNVSQLPATGVATEAYFVNKDLWVWVTKGTPKWTNCGEVGGMNAYELAVLFGGFVGTMNEYLESLVSTVPGPQGANLRVLGTVANAAALSGLQNPVDQDGWVANDTGRLHIRTGTTWKDVGPFRGKSSYQSWLDAGNTGTEAQFVASLPGKDGEPGEDGEDGKDGQSLIIKGAVNKFTDLPTSPVEQDIYAVRELNMLYVRRSGAWQSLGEFKGEDGLNGKDAAPISIIKVLTPQDPNPPAAAGNEGKVYIDLDKRMKISIGGVWVDAGPAGVPGERGETGTGVKFVGTVYNAGALPSATQAGEGAGYFTSIDKMLYVSTGGQWAGPFDITGLKGDKGEPGPEGQAGKSVGILGAYATMALLEAAHPTGNLGDGYLIGDNLAIWTTAGGGKWIDIGLIRGPEGPPGPPGPVTVGKPGIKGDKGSSWIILPEGMDEPGVGFTGNVGDWAVNKSFQVFYKTAATGWIHWGQLVAGDVNSPLASFGKAVRLGNQWVKLSIDEVTTVKDGELYVRAKKADSATETEWVKLVFPESIPDSPADGERYVRTRALNGTGVGSWSKLGKIIPEPTKDGKKYGRVNPTASDQDAKWEEIAAGVADLTTANGKVYARVFESGGTAPIWKEIIIPTGTVTDLTTNDGKQYVRVFPTTNGAVPIWKEIVAPVFDRYTLKALGFTSTTVTLDLSVAQCFSVDAPAARTINFTQASLPAADRAMTVIVVISGAGAITWPNGIIWHGGAQPTQGATLTLVTLYWEGPKGRWVGSAGATV